MINKRERILNIIQGEQVAQARKRKEGEVMNGLDYDRLYLLLTNLNEDICKEAKERRQKILQERISHAKVKELAGPLQ